MINLKRKNRIIHIYIISAILIIALSTVFFIMYKYNIEGERNLPFNITKLIVISSAETENFEKQESIYQADVIQKNDIYIAIEKNQNYKKTDAIKEITFNNFKILEQSKIGKLNFYRTTAEGTKTFEYTENYLINNEIKYIGGKETNLQEEQMTIANQGGLIKISATIEDLGKLTYTENENITSDGRLLNKLNLKSEDIKTKISFDVIMKLSSGNTFKTTITLDLPTGDIVNEGVSTTENNNLEKLVFKRV